MYTPFQLAKKYIHYYFTASNGKGHGVHSPFVFDFIKNVLNDRKKYPVYHPVEKLRKKLLQDARVIEVEDFGAGSLAVPGRKKKVGGIARSFLKPRKYAQLLYRICRYYHPKTIVELGTSLGVTSAYLAASNTTSELFTLEGSNQTAQIARQNFQDAGLQNIKLIQGKFEDTLPELLSSLDKIDLAFIDGNHRKAPTMQYFEQLLKKSTDQTILIFDDIHWSVEMEEAWHLVRQHPSVTLTIDLFFIGIVFFKKDFKVKQDFAIRF